MSEAQVPVANWYPDPGGIHEHRYWDGSQWTDNVSDGGRTSVDPLGGTVVPTSHHDAAAVQRQVQQGANVQVATQGGGTLFTEPVLVVNQKRKLIELANEFAIYDQHGTQIGAIREVGQSAAKKAVRLLSSMDQSVSYTHLTLPTNREV